MTIARNFGTWRGLIRLVLSWGEYYGGLAGERKPRAEEVRRLVFVCHGNICRSAYADILARRMGICSASFGLSTSSGKGAHPPIIDAAAQMGVDLRDHITTNVTDFEPRPGDYLLAMESRHLRKLARMEHLGDLPRALLGGYARPPFPHLHDPYQLDPAYGPVCLARISDALERLSRIYPNARLS